MKIYIAHAIIADENISWEEEFEVSSKKDARAEIEHVLANYNNSLRNRERPRKLVDIKKIAEEELQELPPLPGEIEEDDWEEEDDPYDNMRHSLI